MDFFH
ncbi:hypothetical protein D018_0838A, partial [Vibrio parahaemolyticus VP2007-007]